MDEVAQFLVKAEGFCLGTHGTDVAVHHTLFPVLDDVTELLADDALDLLEEVLEFDLMFFHPFVIVLVKHEGKDLTLHLLSHIGAEEGKQLSLLPKLLRTLNFQGFED